MGNELDREILEEYGVDTAGLARQYGSIVQSSIADEHKTIIEAVATIIAISMSQGDVHTFAGAAMTLFAIGYKAGQDAPDLSLFEDALSG